MLCGAVLYLYFHFATAAHKRGILKELKKNFSNFEPANLHGDHFIRLIMVKLEMVCQWPVETMSVLENNLNSTQCLSRSYHRPAHSFHWQYLQLLGLVLENTKQTHNVVTEHEVSVFLMHFLIPSGERDETSFVFCFLIPFSCFVFFSQ